jgi:hypothetical protein
MKGTLNLFIVSDATGATAEGLVNSVLVQFPQAKMRIRRYPFVRSLADVDRVIEDAPRDECIVVFTFALTELSEAIVARGRAKGLIMVDVINPLMDIVSEILHDQPTHRPGIQRAEVNDLHRLTEAIHYTLRHDDGRGIETLDQADLIILGVSRTGKTPASIFLGCRKLKVANVPIIKGIPLDEAVFRVKVQKVGFRISHERLCTLRSERRRQMGAGMIAGYSDEMAVFEELEYAEAIFKRMPRLRIIDITDRSVEETCNYITRRIL